MVVERGAAVVTSITSRLKDERWDCVDLLTSQDTGQAYSCGGGNRQRARGGPIPFGISSKGSSIRGSSTCETGP